MNEQLDITIYVYSVLKPELIQSEEHQNILTQKLLTDSDSLSSESLLSIFSSSTNLTKKYCLYFIFERLLFNPIQWNNSSISPTMILDNMIKQFPFCSSSIECNFKSYLITSIVNSNPISKNIENIIEILSGCIDLEIDIQVEKQFVETKILNFAMESLYTMTASKSLENFSELILILIKCQSRTFSLVNLINQVTGLILDSIVEIYDLNDLKKLINEEFNINTTELLYILPKFQELSNLDNKNTEKLQMLHNKIRILPIMSLSEAEIVNQNINYVSWSNKPVYKREENEFDVEVLLGYLPNDKLVAKKTYFIKGKLTNAKWIYNEFGLIERMSNRMRGDQGCFLDFYKKEIKDNEFCVYMEGYRDSFYEFLRILDEKKSKLDNTQVNYYIKKLIYAYAEMENENIFHRDVKPENILISKDRKNLKIIDFSVSKIAKADKILGVHKIKGTKDYMAPEIFEPYLNSETKCEYDLSKADVFSLGLTIYKILTFEETFLLNHPKNNNDLQRKLESLKLDSWAMLLLKEMLKGDYHSRPSFKQCLKYIQEENTVFN